MDKAVVAMDLSKVQEAASALRKQGWEAERIRAHLEKELRVRSARFQDGTEFSIDYVNEFLQFVFQLANEDLCAKVLAVQVLQDAFDVSLIKRCQDLFSIVEDNIFKWKSPPYFEVCKNQILRLCNDLLKRLSRTVDTGFCGRILILLAKSLPLSEKSGLNLASQFNVANTTSVEEEKKELGQDEPDADADENDMEVGEIRENKDAAIPVDYELYKKFWGLQHYFVNPNTLYDRNKWKDFESDLTEILGVFATYKLERTGEKPRTSFAAQLDRDRPGSSVDHNGANGINGDESPQDNNNDTMDFSRAPVEDDGFFAKHLTNQKLFHLQLADSQFRRYFLVQCLILANYLTSDVKFRDASLSLRPDQENFVKEFTDTCYQLLRETYPHGSQFSEAIRKSLLREKMWSNWKNEGCQDIVTPLLNQKCLPFK
ncbi:THO complex subunit 1, partial [Aphelenchoides avenae]